MTNAEDFPHKHKAIEVEEAYDAFYRRGAWRLIIEDAFSLGEGRRGYHSHVIRTAKSPRYKILHPSDEKPVNLDSLTERDLENFIGGPRDIGPGVKTTLDKMHVIDAYLKIRCPEHLDSLHPDRIIDLYASVRAKVFARKWSIKWLRDTNKLSEALEGLFIKQEPLTPTIIIGLINVPKKPYFYVHIFNLNDSDNWNEIANYTLLKKRVPTFPDFTRWSGFAVFSERALTVELQDALDGIPFTFNIYPRQAVFSGMQLAKDSERTGVFAVINAASHLNGDYKKIEEDNEYYMFSKRLVEHFGIRV